MNFWQRLEKPILGLAPMDGVTDVSYRQVQSIYGKPDVVVTEFIPVEGIVRMSKKLLIDFWYLPEQRPVVAQIYGNDPELFYASAQLVCELGFDGVDINMGCPAKSVVHRGCGAALIDTPEIAQKLVLATKQGVADWVEAGINWEKWPEISAEKAQNRFKKFITKSQAVGIYKNYKFNDKDRKRESIPVTVKTRTGFREPVVNDWIPALLDVEPVVIGIHGRTLRQMYMGEADWTQIAQSVKIRDKSGKNTLIFGNGDVKSPEDVKRRVEETGVDGIYIGRGTFGNPWIFKDAKQGSDSIERDLEETFTVMKEHAKLHYSFKEEKSFVQMRKNLAWYIKGIPGAAELRSKLVTVDNPEEVNKILEDYLKHRPD